MHRIQYDKTVFNLNSFFLTFVCVEPRNSRKNARTLTATLVSLSHTSRSGPRMSFLIIGELWEMVRIKKVFTRCHN